MSAASIYEGQTTLIPVVNSFGNVFEEWQLATLNQTIFNILGFQYTPGTNTLLVFRNGLLQQLGTDYLETDADTVTFLTPQPLNTKLAFYAFATQGVAIPNGGGVPAGGTAGQALVKINSSDYATQWVSLTALASLLDAAVQTVASANTINLGPFATVSRNLSITGTTTIAGFQVAAGQLYSVRAAGAFKLTNSANLICPGGVDLQVRAGDSFLLRAVADNAVEILSFSKGTVVGNTYAQSYLALSGGNLLLKRSGGGSLLTIAGNPEIIPVTGVTLAATGLTSLTTYFIYAYMSAGVMTLEASTTGHSTDATTGIEIKTGDSTRSLVGMARPTAGPAWSDTLTGYIGVISYYNQRAKLTRVINVSSSPNSSTTEVELNSGLRTSFLTWGDKSVKCTAHFIVNRDVGGFTWMGLADTSAAAFTSAQWNSSPANQTNDINLSDESYISEGYHYYTITLRNTAGTSTFNGQSSPPAIVPGILVTVQG